MGVWTGVWDDLAPWLRADLTLKGLGDPALNGRIFRRYPTQKMTKPYVYILGPHDFDNGTTAGGVLHLKLSCFRIIVATNGTVGSIAPIAMRIKALMEVVRGGVQIGDSWVQSFILQDMREVEVEDPEGGQALLPAIDLWWLSGFSYKPAS